MVFSSISSLDGVKTYMNAAESTVAKRLSTEASTRKISVGWSVIKNEEKVAGSWQFQTFSAFRSALIFNALYPTKWYVKKM